VITGYTDIYTYWLTDAHTDAHTDAALECKKLVDADPEAEAEAGRFDVTAMGVRPVCICTILGAGFW